MKQLEFALCCLTLCGGAAGTLAAGERADEPVLMMRVRSNDTASRGIWKSNLKALAAHPGCCDEIWFSTGAGLAAGRARGRGVVRDGAENRRLERRLRLLLPKDFVVGVH